MDVNNHRNREDRSVLALLYDEYRRTHPHRAACVASKSLPINTVRCIRPAWIWMWDSNPDYNIYVHYVP